MDNIGSTLTKKEIKRMFQGKKLKIYNPLTCIYSQNNLFFYSRDVFFKMAIRMRSFISLFLPLRYMGIFYDKMRLNFYALDTRMKNRGSTYFVMHTSMLNIFRQILYLYLNNIEDITNNDEQPPNFNKAKNKVFSKIFELEKIAELSRPFDTYNAKENYLGDSPLKMPQKSMSLFDKETFKTFSHKTALEDIPDGLKEFSFEKAFELSKEMDGDVMDNMKMFRVLASKIKDGKFFYLKPIKIIAQNWLNGIEQEAKYV